MTTVLNASPAMSPPTQDQFVGGPLVAVVRAGNILDFGRQWSSTALVRRGPWFT